MVALCDASSCWSKIVAPGADSGGQTSSIAAACAAAVDGPYLREADLPPLDFPLGRAGVPSLGARGVAVLGILITIRGLGLSLEVPEAWVELLPRAAGGGGVRGDGRRWRCRRERARVHAGMREELAARVGASRTCEGRFAAHDPVQPPAPAGGGGSGGAGGSARAPPAAAGAAAAGSQGGGDARPCAEGAVDPRSAAAAAWREGHRSGKDR